LTYN